MARPGPRYELPEDGMDQDHEARHDRLCLLRLSGSSVRSWRSRHTATSRPEPEAGHLAHRQVQDHRRGVTLPRQMDHYYNEKLKKYKDGTLPIIYGTNGSLHPVWRHLEELHVDVEKLSIRATFAIAYMAAKANEHLTRLIRRDRLRASHPERPRSPPTSDCHEAPEQKELSSLLTNTGESSEHPAHPTVAGQRGTQQA
ncbi:Hypothetical protein GSB_154145 [Giardia duodenalis]|uniref:Reverse transcriptase/endonuclease n=1 Tax=Giardia intestinalis TaxID=5741 RepID=V6TW24_GIAIN|nr:Hypothetical protein GSB_154145 [Giardia intestinalis]